MRVSSRSLRNFIATCLLAAPIDAAVEHVKECYVPSACHPQLTLAIGVIIYHLLEKAEHSAIHRVQHDLPVATRLSSAAFAFYALFQSGMTSQPFDVTVNNRPPSVSRSLPPPKPPPFDIR